MRTGAIDIGTNTALFVIADADQDGTIRTLYEDHEIIRLGQHVDASGMIQPAAVERCVTVINRFREKGEQFGCSHWVAAGTSAIRDAGNQAWFLNEVFQGTGVHIGVLTGDDEALCTYFGGRLTIGSERRLHRAMVIDIGGGSTEIVMGDQQKIDFKISMNIGAVRLTERFLKTDPVEDTEELRMREHCGEVIRRSLSGVRVTPDTEIIGVAGTITTLASMIQRRAAYHPESINGFPVTLHALNDQISRLRMLPINRRKLIEGLEPKRADVIFAGAVIMEELLRFFNLSRISASTYGLRYGLILKELKLCAALI